MALKNCGLLSFMKKTLYRLVCIVSMLLLREHFNNVTIENVSRLCTFLCCLVQTGLIFCRISVLVVYFLHVPGSVPSLCFDVAGVSTGGRSLIC